MNNRILSFPARPDAESAQRLKEAFANLSPPVVATDDQWLEAAKRVRESAAEHRHSPEPESPLTRAIRELSEERQLSRLDVCRLVPHEMIEKRIEQIRAGIERGLRLAYSRD